MDDAPPLGDGVGVAIDVYHVWWDPDLDRQIARAGRDGRILAFHICDWLVPTTDLLNDRGMMGDGVIDLKGFRKMIEDAEARGVIIHHHMHDAGDHVCRVPSAERRRDHPQAWGSSRETEVGEAGENEREYGEPHQHGRACTSVRGAGARCLSAAPKVTKVTPCRGVFDPPAPERSMMMMAARN